MLFSSDSDPDDVVEELDPEELPPPPPAAEVRFRSLSRRLHRLRRLFTWLSFIASCRSFSLIEHSSSSSRLCSIPTSFLRSSAARDSRVQSMKALPLLLLVLALLPFLGFAST